MIVKVMFVRATTEAIVNRVSSGKCFAAVINSAQLSLMA